MASDHERFLAKLKTLERQLDRIASEFFFVESFLDAPQGSFWQPPTDVYETDGEVVVRMEAPGLEPKDIVIALRENMLLVRAVRRDRTPHAKRAYRQLEIRYGAFERVVSLPPNIRHDQARATYSGGFLQITLPKAQTARRPRTVVRIRL